MNLEVFCEGEEFYTRGPGTAPPLRWRQEEGHWVCARQEVPAGAAQAELAGLPVDLQEEMLAYAARSATAGLQYRNPLN